jgi:transporter family-2 protein
MGYYFFALTAGMALALQVGVNGSLRTKAGSPVVSSFISFLVGTIGLGLVLLYMLLSGSYSFPANMFREIKWWMLSGGILGAFYIFITIFVSPKIGFTNMFSLVICGQIILSVIFDHFGVLGNEVHLINPLRILGVVLLIFSVILIQKF